MLAEASGIALIFTLTWHSKEVHDPNHRCFSAITDNP